MEVEPKAVDDKVTVEDSENGGAKRSSEEDEQEEQKEKRAKTNDVKTGGDGEGKKEEQKNGGEVAAEESGGETVGPKSFDSAVVMIYYFYKILHLWSPNVNLNKVVCISVLYLGVGVSHGNVPVYHDNNLRVLDRRVRLVELSLRCLICGLVVGSAVLIGTNAEVKEIFSIPKWAKFTDMKSLVLLVIVNGIAAAYSFFQVVRCVVSVVRGSVVFNKPLAWAIFFGDHVILDLQLFNSLKFGDLLVDALVPSCGSLCSFVKSAGVYFNNSSDKYAGEVDCA